jgi:hypothetical protein
MIGAVLDLVAVCRDFAESPGDLMVLARKEGATIAANTAAMITAMMTGRLRVFGGICESGASSV